MAQAIDRRAFLVRAAGVSGVVVLVGSGLRTVLAGAATVAGPGPYGALTAVPDANGFLLPHGFSSRLLATSGAAVGATGYVWHFAPDGGACFPAPGGGWAYVSNSEVPAGGGGAGALKFDASGAVVDAYRILGGTDRNCAGGKTAAGTWFSCEEAGAAGKVYECDPLVAGQGVQRPALGSFAHEAAFEDPQTGFVYLTEDDPAGRLYRFAPTTRGDFSAGQLSAAAVANGVLGWIPTSATAPDRQATTTAFNGGEGLVIEGRTLYFTTKGDKRVWQIDLDGQTISVLYDGVATPDAALNAVDNVTVHAPSGDVFVCEDGGNMEVCVIARAGGGGTEVAAFLRIVGQDASEWTGVAFSPDQTRMYLSSQRGIDGRTGRTYEITGPFRTGVTPPPPPPPPAVETLLAAGGVWKYSDRGTDLGTAWRSYHYDDARWAAGGAPLGYGDPMTTTIGFGPNANAKYATTYFRRTFSATHGFASLTLNLRRDDGAVVYLNGTEVARSNMPAGAVSASTLATTAIGGADETAFIAIPVSGPLYQGTNVLAVEIHQAAGTSSDVGFECALTGTGDTGALPSPPAAPVTTVTITEDAHVRGGTFATTNSGMLATALVQSGAVANTRWYYVKVDTAAHTAAVTKALLRLRAQGAAGVTTPLVVKAVTTAWTETGLTWNTKPVPGATVASGSVVGNAPAWIAFDVTAYLKRERAAGRTLVGFVVQAVPATSAQVQIATAEATTVANRPQLVVSG